MLIKLSRSDRKKEVDINRKFSKSYVNACENIHTITHTGKLNLTRITIDIQSRIRDISTQPCFERDTFFRSYPCPNIYPASNINQIDIYFMIVISNDIHTFAKTNTTKWFKTHHRADINNTLQINSHHRNHWRELGF